jgi:hypothetical protein
LRVPYLQKPASNHCDQRPGENMFAQRRTKERRHEIDFSDSNWSSGGRHIIGSSSPNASDASHPSGFGGRGGEQGRRGLREAGLKAISRDDYSARHRSFATVRRHDGQRHPLKRPTSGGKGVGRR